MLISGARCVVKDGYVLTALDVGYAGQRVKKGRRLEMAKYDVLEGGKEAVMDYVATRGGTIVTETEQDVIDYLLMAHARSLYMRRPITYNDFIQNRYDPYLDDHIVIDGLYKLAMRITKVPIHAVTI